MRPRMFVLTVLLLAPTLPASDPVGIYGVVDRVVPEPEGAQQERVQVWGRFSFVNRSAIDSYLPPASGYLYYGLPEAVAEADTARIEWEDLKSLAGTGEVVAFGSRYLPAGRLRAGCERPTGPDLYPLGFGLVRISPDLEYGPVVNLLSVPAPLSPRDGGRAPAGPVTLSARNIAVKGRPEVRYLFSIQDRLGAREESPEIPLGWGQTSWSPDMEVQAGEQYTWEVWAVEGSWRSAVASACFQNTFLRGDSNSDRRVDISDPLVILFFLFQAGCPHSELEAADANGDAHLDVSDPLYLLHHLYVDGPPPPPPYPEVGLKPL